MINTDKVQNLIYKFGVTIGMLPTGFKNSLTYEEQLFAIHDYIENTLVPALNTNVEALQELQSLFLELQDYVNNYFDNLDVQNEINQKLDEMSESGELEEIMEPYFDELVQRINNLETTMETINSNLDLFNTNSQNRDTNLQNQINEIVAGAGTEGSSSAEILQARVNTNENTFSTLNERINYIEKTVPFKMGTITNADFNSFVEPGKYIVTSVSANSPYGLGSSGVLIVEALNPNALIPTNFQWIVQRWYPLNPNGTATRFIQRQTTGDNPTYIFKDWIIVNNTYLTQLYNKLTRSNLSDNYNSNGIVSDRTLDFNTFLKDGNYIFTVTNNPNNPLQSSGFLNVETNYKTGNTFIWCTQTFSDTQLTKLAQRIIQYNVNNPENSIYRDWKIIYNDISLKLTGKKVANFGDSIFGNFQGNQSISHYIQNITNATCYNLGFGGCRMSDRNGSLTSWNPFSMCNLATAIATNDFSAQDTAINNSAWTDKPSYFNSTLNLLKSIDFSEVNYVTIAYGTNDYTAGTLLDDENDLKNQLTFAGALRYTIETLLTAYPNLRILIGCPIWRCWLNNEQTEVEETSDTKTFAPGNYTLKDMVNKCIEIGKEYHIPVLNAYDNLSLNEYNWSSFFASTDTTHPNLYGRQCLAREYSAKLMEM